MAEVDVEMEMEVEILAIHPVKDFRSIVRRSRKRREQRRSGGNPVEVVTIPDESNNKKRKRQEDSVTDSDVQVVITVPQSVVTLKDSAAVAQRIVAVAAEEIEEPKQGLNSDNVRTKIARTSSIGRGGTTNGLVCDSASDTVIRSNNIGTTDNNDCISDSTNGSVISTCTNANTNDSGVGIMSDFANDSITSDSDSFSNSGNDSILTTSSTDEFSFVFDSDAAGPISTAGQGVIVNCSSADEENEDPVVSPPSPLMAEESANVMSNLSSQLTCGDFDSDEGDDKLMPNLLPESTDQSECYNDTGSGDGGQVQVTRMEDEDGVEDTEAVITKKFSVAKRRFGTTYKKRGAFLSLEEARSVYISRPLWCKLCDTFYETIDDLRIHIEKRHKRNGSLVNRFNVATWDLEIARTFENPLELEKAQDT